MPGTKRANSGTVKKPRLGQNFLADAGAAEKIVDALGDVSESLGVDLGPGKGALTQALVWRAKRLIAVELDRMMSAELRFKYRLQPQAETMVSDVLKLDFRT